MSVRTSPPPVLLPQHPSRAAAPRTPGLSGRGEGEESAPPKQKAARLPCAPRPPQKLAGRMGRKDALYRCDSGRGLCGLCRRRCRRPVSGSRPASSTVHVLCDPSQGGRDDRMCGLGDLHAAQICFSQLWGLEGQDEGGVGGNLLSWFVAVTPPSASSGVLTGCKGQGSRLEEGPEPGHRTSSPSQAPRMNLVFH